MQQCKLLSYVVGMFTHSIKLSMENVFLIYMAAGLRAGTGDYKSPQALPYTSDGAKKRRFLETAKLFLTFLFRFVENAYICSVKQFDMNTMETNERHADIASEPVMARRATTFQDVMIYLHSINISHDDKVSVGKQLLFEAQNEYISKALSRLDSLSMLSHDWDGYNASPVAAKVIDNVKAVLAVSEDEDWKPWMISPETNGTLCLQSKTNTSSISMGMNEFSYYTFSQSEEQGESHVPFTPGKFLNVMRRIA